MAIRFAIQSGNWSSGSTWDSFAQLGFPNGEDDVYANSYTVAMDTSVDVRSLNNSQTPRVVENIATPAMTSNATPSGFVFASGFTAGSEPWRAFDQISSTAWASSVSNTGTLTYQFPTARNIKRYAIRSFSSTTNVPRQWTLEGSNDNIAFTVLDTVTASLAPSSVYTSSVLANTASFIFYRYNITAVQTAGNAPQVAELELTESTGSGAGNLSGGTFNFNTPNVSASVGAGLNASATNLITVTATTGTVNISAPNATVANPSIGSSQVINHSGNCNLTISAVSFQGAPAGSNQSDAVCIRKTSTGLITINGNLISGFSNGGSANNALISTAGNTIVNGNVSGFSSTTTGPHYGINQNTGTLTINGNVTGGGGLGNIGLLFSGTTLTITGSITGGTTGVGASISSAATVNISGSVTGTATSGITTTQAVTLTVNGTVTGGSGAVGISSTSTSATNRLTGPFITGPTGIQPFYGPKLTIVTGSATYWTFTAPNLTTNKTLYSTDLVSGVPSPANVRQGVTYASGALTGTMIVPATSSVAFGVPVGSSTGSAIIVGSNYDLSGQVWNTPVTSLTGSSTIGARLRNNATVASTGAQIAAMAGL